jgi:YjbE family integral membrane protein
MTPEFLSSAWWSALASIIVIDLVLAGDNAIVIGLAARNVPPERRRMVVLWGTAGAIGVRILLTLVVVWLLRIPGFLVAGGAALCYIAWKLTRGDDPGHAVEARTSVRGAIRTIVIADAVMGVDNVLAVGGAAHGSLWLVVIGLAVSVPIVVWGSTLVLKWVDRFPPDPVARRGGARMDGRQDDRQRAAGGADIRCDALAAHAAVPGGGGHVDRGARLARPVARRSSAIALARRDDRVGDAVRFRRARARAGVRSHRRLAVGPRDHRSRALDRVDSARAPGAPACSVASINAVASAAA